MCGTNPLNKAAISYNSPTIDGGVMTLDAVNRPVKNFEVDAIADYTLSLLRILDGGKYRLAITATTPANTLTLPANTYFVPGNTTTVPVAWAGADTRILEFTKIGSTVFCYWETMTAGSSGPSKYLKTLADLNTTMQAVQDQSGNNSQLFLGTNKSAFSGSLSVGQSSAPSAIVDIKGSGATSATTSLLVRNSSGSQIFKTTDDGCAYFGSSGQAKFTASGQLEMDVWRSKTSFADDHLTWGSDQLDLTIANNAMATFKGNFTNAIGNATTYGSALMAFNSTSKGILAPRMTTAQKNAISAPENGLLVYDTTLGAFSFYRTADAAWKSISYT